MQTVDTDHGCFIARGMVVLVVRATNKKASIREIESNHAYGAGAPKERTPCVVVRWIFKQSDPFLFIAYCIRRYSATADCCRWWLFSCVAMRYLLTFCFPFWSDRTTDDDFWFWLSQRNSAIKVCGWTCLSLHFCADSSTSHWGGIGDALNISALLIAATSN